MAVAQAPAAQPPVSGSPSYPVPLPPGMLIPGGPRPSDKPALPVSDTLQQAMAMRPPPDSRWFTDDRAQFATLAAGTYDILVAPVTSYGLGFSRSTRSLVQARIAALLADRGLRVVNPYVAQRALGEGARSLLLSEIQAYAKQVGAARIILPDLTHDAAGNMRLVIKSLSPTNEAQVPDAMVDRQVPLGATVHPVAELEGALKEFAERFGGDAKSTPRAAARPATESLLADTPRRALATPTEDVARSAFMLQYLATLMPAMPERSRERAAEQALLMAQRLPASHPLRSFLVARGWWQVGSRLMALEAIKESRAQEALALRQFFNGNLAELAAAVGNVTQRDARMLLEMDLTELRYWYSHSDLRAPNAAVERMRAAGSGWTQLYQRRLDDFDPWSAGATRLAKTLLDRDLALEGASLSEKLEGRTVLGKAVDRAVYVKAALAHLQRVRREDAHVKACLAAAVPCVASAYVDTLEAIALSDAVRSVRKAAEMQGMYSDALALAGEYKPELDGFPALMLAEADAHFKMKDGRGAYAPAMRELAKGVAWLERGQSRDTFDALVLLGIPSADSMPFIDAYVADLPSRDEWLVMDWRRYPRQPGEFRGLIDEARYDLQMLQTAVRRAPELRDAAREALETRFRGNPRRLEVLATLTGQKPDSIELLQLAKKERPDRWASYDALAKRQLESGEYKAALSTYREFPGFGAGSRLYDAVSLSNFADDAGSRFFARGLLSEAREFYKLAIARRTGAQAEMIGDQRLATMNGDFESAAAAAFRRVSRYDSASAKRDYLAWLFALGYTSEAWAAFAQIASDQDAMQSWLAADAGLRIGARDWPTVKNWLLSEPQRSAHLRGTPYGIRVAIMQSAVDRTPADDFGATVRTLAGAPLVLSPGTSLAAPTAPGAPRLLDGRIFPPPSRFRFGLHKDIEQVREIYSPFVMFADAYALLRRGDFAGAVEKFDFMAAIYPIEGHPGVQLDGYALPYFAWASAQTGDSLGLERFLLSAPPQLESQRFDYELSLAFFAGRRGEHAVALKHLDNAFNQRPSTDARPIPTEYQWAEACEWLYQATNEKRYLDAALKWAKTHQRLQPMMAWAYAIEAKYTTNEAERVRALAIAQYLDPLSERIAGVDANLKARAKAWLAANNPFARKSQPARES